jgi:hypothetical protein
MSRKSRRVDEVLALEAAHQTLEKIFGHYMLDDEVWDSPDAALITDAGKKIGIEITCMDSKNYLKYSNTELSKLNRNSKPQENSYLKGETKTVRIELFPHLTAQNLALKKNPKFEKYKNSSHQFDEVILLLHTQLSSITDASSFPIEHYLFSIEAGLRANNLKFDRVILVGLRNLFSREIFQQTKNLFTCPSDYNPMDWITGNHYIDTKSGIFQVESDGGEINVAASLGRPISVYK